MLKNNWIRIFGIFVLFVVIALGNITKGQTPTPTPSGVPICTSQNCLDGCSQINPFCCPQTGGCADSVGGLSGCPDTICIIPSPTPAPMPTPTPTPSPRTITFINNCNIPIWVGGSNASGVTGEATGFGMAPTPNTCSSNSDCTIIDPSFTCSGGECVDSSGNPANMNVITVPGDLKSADFWPRTGCTFPCSQIPCCDTGDCAAESFGMGIQCNGGTKGPPANSFEVDMNPPPGNDFYDLTNVDGYAVGISVEQINGQSLNPPVSPSYLNCGNPICDDFDMTKCPPELSQTTNSDLQVCWALGDAANNSGQIKRDTSNILKNIAADCNTLSLAGCSCAATSTSNVMCGSTSPLGCGKSDSLFCCSPYNSQLPDPHGLVCCAHATDPAYVQTCDGVWPTPSTTWCTQEGISSSDCTYDQIFKSQCKDAYSWQFNDSSSTYQCIGPNYQITFCPETDNDSDGISSSRDDDSDNDGIPDDLEGRGSGITLSTNAALDINENETTVARQFDTVDPDGDGIPNHLDLDSDGDGKSDVIEAGGSDANRNGIIDNFTDSDGDGLADSVDPDQGGIPLPVPDTDGDGIPNFLDPSGTQGSGCSIALAGATLSIPLFLVIPVFIVIRRMWKRYKS